MSSDKCRNTRASAAGFSSVSNQPSVSFASPRKSSRSAAPANAITWTRIPRALQRVSCSLWVPAVVESTSLGGPAVSTIRWRATSRGAGCVQSAVADVSAVARSGEGPRGTRGRAAREGGLLSSDGEVLLAGSNTRTSAIAPGGSRVDIKRSAGARRLLGSRVATLLAPLTTTRTSRVWAHKRGAPTSTQSAVTTPTADNRNTSAGLRA